jgi:crotonobetainyl-CoA:carnitine CoA-transferase CaiB-like acyl-CoA transferase
MSSATPPAALAGLRVLEYGELVSAPFATKALRDLGAEVVKVEPPRGDIARSVGPFPHDSPDPEASGLFAYLNGGKRGVTLDLHRAPDLEAFRRLIAQTDVLVESAPVDQWEALGLSHADLLAASPRLIQVSITPFGHSGPYSHYKGYELNAMALAGVPMALGEQDRPPLPVPDFIGDFFTGSVAALGVMLNLFARDAAGINEPEWIDLSSSDAWATLQTGLGVVQWLFGSRITLRHGRRKKGGPYPFTILRCADGDFRLIAMTKREWVRFLDAMGNPEWGKDPRFQDRVKMNDRYADELDALISEWLMTRTKQQLFELCYSHGVPFTPVKDFGDVMSDPQLVERRFFVDAEDPRLGPVRMPGPPFHFGGLPLAEPRRAPRLGEHNAELLGSLAAPVSAER